MTLSAGSRLGPYEVLAPVGAGGMGEVYKARDTRLERTVAIKTIRHAQCRGPVRPACRTGSEFGPPAMPNGSLAVSRGKARDGLRGSRRRCVVVRSRGRHDRDRSGGDGIRLPTSIRRPAARLRAARGAIIRMRAATADDAQGREDKPRTDHSHGHGVTPGKGRKQRQSCDTLKRSPTAVFPTITS